mgnify:CR=1 FL=1
MKIVFYSFLSLNMRTNIHNAFTFAFLLILFSCAVFSCTKAPLNEADGSFFFQENTPIVFEDKGYILKDIDGNISIACFDGPKVIGEERNCINIFVPQNCFTLSDSRLSFRNSFDAKVRFFTKFYEYGGHATVQVHLEQNTKVHIRGSIANDTGEDFFQTGNVYPCSISLSFSLEDGTNIRLQMNTMTVSDEQTLIGGWR